MNHFVKVYGSILTSSIWLESESTRLVWITMLVLADEEGLVGASLGGLAHAARVSREDCIEALRVLSAPDPETRDRSSGQRVQEVVGGYQILNYRRYREMRTRKQVALAKRVAAHRVRKRALAAAPPPHVTVNDVTPEVEVEVESEGESERERERESQTRVRARELAPTPDSESAEPRAKKPKTGRALFAAGYRDRFENARQAPWPAVSGRAELDTIGEWVESTAVMRGESREAIATSLLDGIFADERLGKHDWPLRFIAENPARFLGQAKSRKRLVYDSKTNSLKEVML